MTPDAPEDLFNQGVKAYDEKKRGEEKYPIAIALYQEALKAFRDRNDDFWIARTLNALGLASHNFALSSLTPDKHQERETGWTNAIEFYQESLNVSSDNRARAAETLRNLSRGYRDLGNYEKAIDANKAALAIYTQELQNIEGVAEKIINLGDTDQSPEQDTEAEYCYLQLIELLEVVSDPSAKEEILIELGNFYYKKGESLRAEFSILENIGLEEFSIALEFFYQAWQINKVTKSLKEREILDRIAESARSASEAIGNRVFELEDFPPPPITSRP
jgi:tetratricopeptide (TPR) repeat protein